MKLCDNIKWLRVKKALSQKELGALLNVSPVSISCWESGTKLPSCSAIIALSQVFGVTTDALLGLETGSAEDDFILSKKERALIESYRSLDRFGRKAVDTICSVEKRRLVESLAKPVCGNTAARYIPKYLTPSAAGASVPLDGEDFEMILVDDSVPYGADFAVIIKGDSMEPLISDGDAVYVKNTTEISVGDVGIFCVDGAMYCKQYYLDGDKNLTLVSLNPEKKNTNVFVSSDSTSGVKCFGVVLLKHRPKLPAYFMRD